MARMPGPAIFGHEAAGVVEAVGQGVDDLQPGDHVVCAFHPSCGRCYYCVRGMPQICDRTDFPERSAGGSNPRLRLDGRPVRQGIGVGGFAEFTCMPRGGVVKVRVDAPLDIVGLVGCGVTTGIGAAINTAKVKPGSTVAVIGCGGVGLNVIQGAKLVGADKIIGVDLNPGREAMARRFGMTHFINPKDHAHVVDRVVQLNDGGADYSFECIGNTTTMRQALECCHKGWGQSIIIGVAPAGAEIATRPFQLVTGRVWKGTAFGGARGRTDVPRIVDWYMEGKIEIDRLITHKLPLEKINDAFHLMHEGTSIRTVIEF
jgi:S-(hydroxymethyl)glutathione dehydrogenase/alcohol dehydrogenase